MDKVRRMRTGVLIAGGSLLAAMLSAMAPAAQAAAPANDTWTSPTQVTSLPFHAKVDTRGASDESVPPPGTSHNAAHSVWYHIVLPKGGPLLISLQDSTFLAHAALFKAPDATAGPDQWKRAGGFTARKGDRGATVRNLLPGKDYYLMIATRTGSKGGTGRLLMRAPAQLTYSLARDGTYDHVDGSAVIHGTISSTQSGTDVTISVSLRQLVGSQVVEGWGSVTLTVGKATMPWQIRVTSGSTFKAGEARVASSRIRVNDHGARLGVLTFEPNAVVTLQ